VPHTDLTPNDLSPRPRPAARGDDQLGTTVDREGELDLWVESDADFVHPDLLDRVVGEQAMAVEHDAGLGLDGIDDVVRRDRPE